MNSVTIDCKPIEVGTDTTVLEAAIANGVDIPRLCYHPELTPSGGCRLCLVEIEGRPEPQASCGLKCEDGMVIRTQSDLLYELRREMINLLISDHPMECATCDKNGACDLQRYVYEFDVPVTTYTPDISRSLYQDDNPIFLRDHKYCILCGRCTRVCDEIVGASAIDIVGRGFTSHMATPFDVPMQDSTCVFCGSCVQVCPTAALMPMSRLRKGREWEFTRTRSICGYCGVGCSLEYALKDGEIIYAQGYPEAPVNGEFTCVKGRSGWDFVTSPDRLTQPLVRRDLAYELGLTDQPWTLAASSPLDNCHGENHIPVSWETALDIVATKLADTVKTHGADAVAGLASARCTNEENYLFQKLIRASIGTNNVDHCARLCHSSTVTGLGMAFGSGAMTNSIGEVRHADCVFITGSNTAESHPVISYEAVRAVKKGAHLVIVDPRRIPLVDHATLFLQPAPGTDIYVFMAMMHVILREGWADTGFIEERTEGFEEFSQSVQEMTPEAASLTSGVPASLIEDAARVYALGERASGTSIYGDGRGHSTILYAMGITQRSNGTDMVLTMANLALLCGQLGKPSTGVNPLRGQANVQGACDLGGLPNVLPGYQKVTDKTTRKYVAQAWGLSDLPVTPGLTIVEMTHAAVEGKIRAMYIMGENPMLSDPNIEHVEKALRSLDFFVAQDIFLSETAQLAHIVLPAASSLEKDGTFTNTERRVQLLEPVLSPPDGARADWQIIAALGQHLDKKLDNGRSSDYWHYSSTEEIMAEVGRATPSYRGITHSRLTEGSLTWPCPSLQHPGTPILHTETFSRGLGRFHPVGAQMPAEQTDEEYPLILTTGRILYHYHTGTMTRRSEGLSWREPNGYAEINADDAEAASINDGDQVVIHSRRGKVNTEARIGQRVPPGVIFLAFHWKEGPANRLTQDHILDPLAKIPEYKVSAVRLEPADEKGLEPD